MRFVVQRRSDHKYYSGNPQWADSEHDAALFLTTDAAYAFCKAQTDDQFDVFIRLRNGSLVDVKER